MLLLLLLLPLRLLRPGAAQHGHCSAALLSSYAELSGVHLRQTCFTKLRTVSLYGSTPINPSRTEPTLIHNPLLFFFMGTLFDEGTNLNTPPVYAPRGARPGSLGPRLGVLYLYRKRPSFLNVSIHTRLVEIHFPVASYLEGIPSWINEP